MMESPSSYMKQKIITFELTISLRDSNKVA